VATGRRVWTKQFPTQTLECAESPDNTRRHGQPL
jgi:hypothetical protein